MPKHKKINFAYAAGRRKSATARVRLYKGKGESTVNGKPIAQYFPGALMESIWSKPLRVIDAWEKYYVTVKVAGGGKRGQVEAMAHGLAKALAIEKKDEFRKPLKDAGLLTRDARIRERRKVGTGGKARRKKQSPKR